MCLTSGNLSSLSSKQNVAKLTATVLSAAVIKPSKKLFEAMPDGFWRAKAQDVGKKMGLASTVLTSILRLNVTKVVWRKLRAAIM
jgi:hypothetical protein